MKRITFLILFISSGIFSQTIQMPSIPEDGVVYQTTTLNAAVSAPSTGPWDFTALNPVDEYDVTIIPIENSAYSTSEYPNTTHVKSFLSGDQQVIQFPGFSSTGYTYNGENSIIINNYSTPLTIMPYPFSVGDSHSDAVYDIEFTCPICPPYMFRDHEITSEALGSGTVTMPDGTVFENVVLVEHVAVFSDAQTGSSPCITTRTSHFWWAPDLGIPLVETFTQETTGACSFDPVQFTRFYTGQGPYTSGCSEPYTLPYLNDFNDTESFNNCMTRIDSDGDGYGWNQAAFDIDGAGNAVADSQSWDGVPLTPDNWLIMGPIDMTNVDDATLSWKVRGIDPAWCGENYTVYISESNDISSLSNSSLYYNETITSASDACGNSFAERTFDISSAVGQLVYIGFRHHDVTDMFRLNIDDVAIDSNSLSTNDFENLNISIYPNPVDGNYITIQTPSNGVKGVEVFDVLGKRVINTNLISEYLDISELNPGVYMVKVTIENQSKVSKLIIK